MGEIREDYRCPPVSSHASTDSLYMAKIKELQAQMSTRGYWFPQYMLFWVELAKQWQKHWAAAFGANAPDFAAAFQNATRNPMPVMNPMQFWMQAAGEWEKHGADAITRWHKLPDFLAAYQNATMNPMPAMNPMQFWMQLAGQWQKAWTDEMVSWSKANKPSGHHGGSSPLAL